eukprot:1921540-Lingulodinium_polyedra.AAC.2
MPEVGCHAAPMAPSTRRRLSASYTEQAGPATHSGTPARASAALTVQSGTRSKAFFQSRAAPAMCSPAASAASSSTASSHASSSAPRRDPSPHDAIQDDMSRARPAAQIR